MNFIVYFNILIAYRLFHFLNLRHDSNISNKEIKIHGKKISNEFVVKSRNVVRPQICLQNREITSVVGNENCGFRAGIKAELVSRSRRDFNFAID